METYDGILNAVIEQEKTLQFDEFNSEIALRIGLSMIEKAKKENKAITVDINKNGHQLFHYALEGTSPDFDQWIIRKNRVVNRFNKSSYHVKMRLLKSGKSTDEHFHISHFDYAVDGGAFPIIIKNTGVVGTITVSGLSEEEDHETVVNALKNYLKK